MSVLIVKPITHLKTGYDIIGYDNTIPFILYCNVCANYRFCIFNMMRYLLKEHIISCPASPKIGGVLIKVT